MSNVDWYRNKLGRTPRSLAEPRAVPRFSPDGAAPGPPPWQAPPQAPDVPIGQLHAGDAVRYWKGTAAAQTRNDGRCPHCGSGNYFATLRAGTMDGHAGESGKESQGHCFDCSYRNGRGPTLQPNSSMRAIRGGEAVPTQLARSPNVASMGPQGIAVIGHVH